jgi:hypothetical protein
MTTEGDIDYEALVQGAMRSVLQKVLVQVAKTGLPGEHHFYISFNTKAPGVVLSKRLKERYPEEMTVVLQHRFWDLAVTDEYFEVKLTFDSIPERLVVPFASIKVFVDPSVRFGHQFEEAETQAGVFADPPASRGEAVSNGRTGSRSGPRSIGDKKRPVTAKKSRTDRADGIDGPTEGQNNTIELIDPATLPEPKKQKPLAAVPTQDKVADPHSDDAGQKVVSLDKFRKK